MKKNTFFYYLNRYKWFLFLLALFFAVVGSYQVFHGQYTNPLKEAMVVLFSTIKLFSFIPLVPITTESPLFYEIAVWLAPAVTVVGFFSIFDRIYRIFAHTIYHWNRNHLVVMGHNEDTIKFIKNHLDTEDKLGVILVCDIADPVDVTSYQNLMTKVVRLDFSQPANPINARTIKDEKLDEVDILISFLNEPENYGQIAAFHGMLGNCEKTINVYLKTQGPRLKQLVEPTLDLMNSFDVHYFSIEDLLVKDFLENSVFQLPKPEGLEAAWSRKDIQSYKDIANKLGRYNILLIGFSDMTRAFLMQSSNLLTVNPMKRMAVTIIDVNATAEFAKFSDYRRELDKVMEVECIDVPRQSAIDPVMLGERQAADPYQLVFFGLDNAIENMVLVDRLVDVFKDVPFAIYTKEEKQVETVLRSLNLKHGQLHAFGDPQKVLDKETIIEEKLYDKAKDFNVVYDKTLEKILGFPSGEESREAKWIALNTIKKESNLYQAAHRETKVMLVEKFAEVLGLASPEVVITQWEQALEGLTVEEQIRVVEEDPYLNFMSALEHKRWSNFYYMRDFVFGEKDEARKTHDCLIDDWDEFLASIQRPKAIYDTLSVLAIYSEEDAHGAME